MFKKLILAAGLLIITSATQAGPQITTMKIECNWGALTMELISGGFDQGAHASDPSGDGRGPEARVGLANVVERGNMEALCMLIEDLVGG